MTSSSLHVTVAIKFQAHGQAISQGKDPFDLLKLTTHRKPTVTKGLSF